MLLNFFILIFYFLKDKKISSINIFLFGKKMKRFLSSYISTRGKRKRTQREIENAISTVNRFSRRRPRITVTEFSHPGSVVSTSSIQSSNGNNFYIIPKEVFDFLSSHPELYDDMDNLNLARVEELFAEYESDTKRFIEFWRGERSDPDFLKNEYKKLHASGKDTRKAKWMFPHLIGYNGSTLSIPCKDVFDLPIYIMLYILRRLTQFPEGKNSFSISYSLGDDSDTTVYPIYKDQDRHPISVINGHIKEDDLEKVYLTLIRKFASLLPDGESTWNGSEDSGTRIMLMDYANNHNLRLKLTFTPTAVVNRAHGWTQEVEDLLSQSVGTSVISVRNKTDNKCLLYCLIMGLALKIKGGSDSRIFGRSVMMVEDSEVYVKGKFLFTDDDEISQQIRKLTNLLLPPVYSNGPTDPLVDFVDSIDKKAGTTLSITEFRKEFAEIEKKLIPESICGVDVYGIDFNVNPHIYPLYISKNRDKVIELLCVTPTDTRCSHYCLIMNKEQLLKKSGGKQFFSCSKCGQCFYHRRLLTEHKCPKQVDKYEVGGDGGYHYSSKNVDPEIDIICGACSKCRLCFTDAFTAEYHKDHCLMTGQTGYRHVQLVTYKPDEHPMLNGEEIDMEQEDKHLLRRRVMYADFESTINPDNGEHAFMSYGIYDTKQESYKCGYELEEFIDTILDWAFDGEEDQIYVYFHNAMGYDANFILRYILSKPEYSNWGIQVIMKSMNKLQKLVFHAKIENKTRTIHIGDTFLFLTLSLERIVGSIRKDDIDQNCENFQRFFEVFKKRYRGVPISEIDHILRKNIFPYKFFTDSEKLDTPIEEFLEIFSPKNENLKYFSERVTLEELEKNFKDTQHVIEVFGCKSAKDYHDLYLCCDVMQLADVFERSMDILWESHHIHLTKYIGMPSASWAAFLRHEPTMSIPLYEDTFYAEFFKAMIRGGITSAPLRYAKADETHSIIYLDVNGLYPYVMQAYKFPCGSFQFLPLYWDEEIARGKLYEYFETFEREGKGMCFCVDLEIPDSVKELTDMYPFAPEHRKIFSEYYKNLKKKELTPFLKKWSAANEDEKMTEFTGLVCTLYNKEKYNVHWRLLKFYIEHGVIVKKVHFGVLFDEGDYLASYIRKNIAIRNTRKDELGKTLYKLLGNSIYGKTFESPFKRNTFEIIRDQAKLQGLLEEGNIAAITPIDDLGWIVRMDGEDIILDKPTYIGACVCEFAKLHMYTLLYDKMMKIFPSTATEIGCQLVYTDTDSFILRVKHPEGSNIKTPQELFDYIKSKDPELIGGIGGQVKSETGEDDTIDEIIALRSKVYAYKTINGHIGKRAKGTTHDAQEMQLDWATYKRALESLTAINTRNVQFVRKTFKIASLEVFRQSLSVNDGKRYICADGIHTHAFGYNKDIEECEAAEKEEEEAFSVERGYELSHYETLDDD